MKEIFEGIYADSRGVYSKNLCPGTRVYGERIVTEKGEEYRDWNPYRSKYCAAIKNGLKESIFFEGAKVLYLGSAEGTTMSHVSDIVGKEGFVFGVDISETAMQKLVELAQTRQNIFPLLGDAQIPEEYSDFIGGKVDALFQDVSQRNQAEIFARNAKFLKKNSLGLLAIKAKSISQTKKVKDVVAEERKMLLKEFNVLQAIPLEPYEKSHYAILVKKK
jgi:fibrillarin-like pre-rRNA processing protein